MKPLSPAQSRMRSRGMSSRALAMMASRVSNIALPSHYYSIFKPLREQAFKRWGNYGLANDPRKKPMPLDQYLAANLPQLPSEAEMETLHERNQFQTRSELMQRDLGMANMSSQLAYASAPARHGIATAAQEKMNPQYATGELGPYPVHSDPKINDTGWGVTLAQMLGSGALTQEQLQAASFANIMSMISTNLDNRVKQEFAFFLQRMAIDGFLRGYDILRELKQGGNTISIRGENQGGYLLGVSYQGNNVVMNYPRWDRLSDETKLTLFYHELGHELLEKPHGPGIMSYDYFSGNWTHNSAQYKQMVDQLFSGAGTIREVPGTNLTAAQVQQLLSQNPNWFPSISGVDPTGVGPLPPGQQPPGTNLNITQTTTYNLIPTAVNPGSSSVGSIMSSGMSGAAAGGINPGQADKTPVAGTLPDMASVQAFAAGLTENAIRGSGIANLGSAALMRLKSG